MNPKVRNLGYGNRSCLDAQGGKKGLRKPVSLYPCHRQGGNQVNMTSHIHTRSLSLKKFSILVAKIINFFLKFFTLTFFVHVAIAVVVSTLTGPPLLRLIGLY
jgi:hypothetical protein